MQQIDCKTITKELLDKVKAVPNKGKLAIITVGNDIPSEVYVRGKKKDCTYCGIEYIHKTFPADCSNIDVATAIKNFNHDNTVAGIILQLPLPKHLAAETLVSIIDPNKDVDGFIRDSAFTPCTPEGVMYILSKRYRTIEGRNVLLIGRGPLVGKPLAEILLKKNCTLTIAHSHTPSMAFAAKDKDIIITATGHKTLNSHMLQLNNFYGTLIDVGIRRDENKKVHGDFEVNPAYINGTFAYTPVPGGMGLMTRAILMTHIAHLNLDLNLK